jgi:hypothetical protein
MTLNKQQIRSTLERSQSSHAVLQGPMDESELALATPTLRGGVYSMAGLRESNRSMRDLARARGWDVMHRSSAGGAALADPRTPTGGGRLNGSGFGMAPPSSMRRSGRFDQHEVLNALTSAPPLPSPALANARILDWSVGGLRESMSMINSPLATPHGHYPGANNFSPQLDKSSWLPSPRASFIGAIKPTAETSVDNSITTKQVLGTQEPEFISQLEKSLVQHSRFSMSGMGMPPMAVRQTEMSVDKEALYAMVETDLEEDLRKAEEEATTAPRRVPEMSEDLEVEEVWEELMLWCAAYDEGMDFKQCERSE